MSIITIYQNKIKQSRFAKNVALVAGGTAFAQIFGVAISPIITRVYSPNDFGMLTVFIAIIGAFNAFTTLRYDSAIVICKDKKEILNVVVLCFLILGLFSIIISVSLLLFTDNILNFFNAEAMASYIFMIPIGLLFIGIYEILEKWMLREKEIRTIAKTKFAQSISSGVLKIVLGVSGLGGVGLILGSIASQSAGILSFTKKIISSAKYSFKMVSKKELINSLYRHSDFPIFSGPNKFLYDFTMQLPALFLTARYGLYVAGFYGLANRIIRLPMNLIGISVKNVFMSELGSLGPENVKEIKALTNKLQKYLIVIGLVPMFVLLFFGPILFSLVFGSEWYEAGVYARILSVAVFFNFISTPISHVSVVFKKLKESLVLTIIRLLFLAIALGISVVLNLNVYITLTIISLAMSVNYILIYLHAQWIMNREIMKSKTCGQ